MRILRNWALALLAGVALAPSIGSSTACLILSNGATLTAGTNILCGIPNQFDFYISPTGDDNNAGTLASPWSISALGIEIPGGGGSIVLNTSNKWSTYKGHRVGLLPGTYTQGTVGGVSTTLYAYAQAGIGSTTIVLQGGTAGNPTYIGSSNSAGQETPRTATIDTSNSGTQPTTQIYLMGQVNQGWLTSMVNGNVTINGLVLTGFMQGGLIFDYSSPGGATGVVVTQNEIKNGLGCGNNNPAGVFLDSVTNAFVDHNKIHDMQSVIVGSTCTIAPWDYFYVISFGTGYVGTVITNNTMYNSGSVGPKTHAQQWATFAYNYVEQGNFGAGLVADDALGVRSMACLPGYICNVHDNIVVGVSNLSSNINPNNQGTVNYYNNLNYMPSSGQQIPLLEAQNSSSPQGTTNVYNNLVYSALGYPSYLGAMALILAPTGFGTVDHNAYDSAATFSWALSGAGDTGVSLSAWRTQCGCDANSVQLSSSPFTGTPTSGVPTSFAISGPATTAGVGGTTTGPVSLSSVGAGF